MYEDGENVYHVLTSRKSKFPKHVPGRLESELHPCRALRRTRIFEEATENLWTAHRPASRPTLSERQGGSPSAERAGSCCRHFPSEEEGSGLNELCRGGQDTRPT